MDLLVGCVSAVCVHDAPNMVTSTAMSAVGRWSSRLVVGCEAKAFRRLAGRLVLQNYSSGTAQHSLGRIPSKLS